MRKCSVLPRLHSTIVPDSVVLIGYNYQDKKTGVILYNRKETKRLILQENEWELPHQS